MADSARSSPGSGRPDRPRADDDALFVYGTLRFPKILVALLGRIPDRRPAAARGWRAAALSGRAYPGLVPGEATVQGLVLTGLTVGEWRVLDAFEGPAYELTRIALIDGRSAWSYVWTARAEVRTDEWSPEDFAAWHLSAYVERCAALRRDLR
jgi:gamma-glutamylcyclotransferase (GGCT)/AIG2-like uncharacterized protein YtfP